MSVVKTNCLRSRGGIGQVSSEDKSPFIGGLRKKLSSLLHRFVRVSHASSISGQQVPLATVFEPNIL
jgi:hypothetical protein